MDFDDILANCIDQDRGEWFMACDPVNGTPTGLEFLLAGPDSKTQADARLALVDELADAADVDGRVNAEARERAQINQLARCIKDWRVTHGGKPLPLTHANAVRLLRAGVWLRAQIDARAASRFPFPIKGA